MMTPDIEKIEHLLNAKSFEQLTPTERELVLAHLSGKAEYEHMRETLSRVKKIFTAEAAFVSAEADMKEYVLNRFEQNKPTSVSLYDRISTFCNTLVPTPTARFGMALGSVLVICAATFLFWPKADSEMAVNSALVQQAPAASTRVDSTKTLNVQDELLAPPMEQDRLSVDDEALRTDEEAVLMDEAMESAGDAAIVQEDIKTLNKQQYPEPKKEIEYRTTEKSISTEVQNNVYMNNEGYYQYRNSRVAEVPTQKANDLKRDYSQRKPTTAEAKTKESERADENETLKLQGKANVEQGTLKTVSGAVTSENIDQTVMVSDLETISIPVWPGLENEANAYEATIEKIKAFITQNSAYKLESTDKNASTTITLILTFNARGQVVKALVKGNIAETAKKEIEEKALQLPAFKFTGGGEGNKQVRQNYSITY